MQLYQRSHSHDMSCVDRMLLACKPSPEYVWAEDVRLTILKARGIARGARTVGSGRLKSIVLDDPRSVLVSPVTFRNLCGPWWSPLASAQAATVRGWEEPWWLARTMLHFRWFGSGSNFTARRVVRFWFSHFFPRVVLVANHGSNQLHFSTQG